MKIKAPIQKFEYDLWSFYLPIREEDAQQFIEGNDRRVTWTYQDEKPKHAALMPKKGIYTLYLTKDMMKQHQLKLGDVIAIDLEKDRSEYGVELPNSFIELLSQDLEGAAYFHDLTKGKQRTLIHLITKVKNVDKQLAKGLAIMEHLKESQGAVDFKRLNILIKKYNNLNF